ncbi:MAG: hypothetical protein LWW94_01935 [Candidatus Desulfofervidaceae bacterium]|nr:hypothetical protein [Candidatus Desulfofervidaceae bacterium]
MEKEKLIWVGDQKALEQAGIMIRPSTLRRWHSIGKCPRLFVRIFGKLCIRVDVWREEVERAIVESEKRAQRIRELKRGE